MMPCTNERGPGTPGKPYRPSNGTEGMIFFDGWCADCKYECSCEIMGDTMVFDINHPQYPEEWIYGDEGWGKCTKFEGER
jgi:hypothetical protein